MKAGGVRRGWDLGSQTYNQIHFHRSWIAISISPTWWQTALCVFTKWTWTSNSLREIRAFVPFICRSLARVGLWKPKIVIIFIHLSLKLSSPGLYRIRICWEIWEESETTSRVEIEASVPVRERAASDELCRVLWCPPQLKFLKSHPHLLEN